VLELFDAWIGQRTVLNHDQEGFKALMAMQGSPLQMVPGSGDRLVRVLGGRLVLGQLPLSRCGCC
jgi:hypothetical protein